MEDIAQIWQFGDPHKLARGFKLSALRKRNVVILFEAKYSGQYWWNEMRRRCYHKSQEQKELDRKLFEACGNGFRSMGPTGKPKYRVVRQLLREGATIDFFAKQCPANPHNIEELEQKMEKYIQNKDEEEFPHEAMTELWEDYVNCIDMVQDRLSQHPECHDIFQLLVKRFDYRSDTVAETHSTSLLGDALIWRNWPEMLFLLKIQYDKHPFLAYLKYSWEFVATEPEKDEADRDSILTAIYVSSDKFIKTAQEDWKLYKDWLKNDGNEQFKIDGYMKTTLLSVICFFDKMSYHHTMLFSKEDFEWLSKDDTIRGLMDNPDTDNSDDSDVQQ